MCVLLTAYCHHENESILEILGLVNIFAKGNLPYEKNPPPPITHLPLPSCIIAILALTCSEFYLFQVLQSFHSSAILNLGFAWKRG